MQTQGNYEKRVNLLLDGYVRADKKDGTDNESDEYKQCGPVYARELPPTLPHR